VRLPFISIAILLCRGWHRARKFAHFVKLQNKRFQMNHTCFEAGYRKGYEFAKFEADYDELAAVYRARGIPASWDLYRAEILNRHMGDETFDFQSYAAGFARACIEFFEKI
jgi:hypothetical protein